jgi:hypothetical protein
MANVAVSFHKGCWHLFSLKTLSREGKLHSARVQQVRRPAQTAALVPLLGHLPLFGQTYDLIRYFLTLSQRPSS